MYPKQSNRLTNRKEISVLLICRYVLDIVMSKNNSVLTIMVTMEILEW